MSAAQYEKWSKYNVEDSLAEVDSKSLVDDRDRKLNKLSVTQATLESSTITENETLALSHTSAAAVDQLKSVRKGRSARKKASGPMVPPPPTPESLKATRASVRAKSLASACAAREAGKVAASEKRYSASLTLFEEGSGFLDVFEENGEPVPVDPSKPEGAVVGNSSSKDLCCGPDAEKIKQQQAELKPDPLQPTAANLTTALRRDLNLNTGRALLELHRYSDASESFKLVLLVDPGNVTAWVARAECFRRMSLFTLADLHLVKAVDIDDIDKNAKAVKTMNDGDLIQQKMSKLLGGVEGGEEDEDEVQMEINSRQSAQSLLANAVVLYKQATVIFREQFFYTASLKYEKAAACLEAAERILMTVMPAGINRIRIASHLGVAASNLLRKRDVAKAEKHCTLALKIEKSNITALLRRAEARSELGKYEDGLDDLGKALRIVERGKGESAVLAKEEIRKRIKRANYIKRLYRGECSWGQ